MGERTIRAVSADELPAFFSSVVAAFGGSDDEDDLPPEDFEVERSVAIFDDGQIVAGCGAYTFELTAPGPVPCPAAGVTWVGVLPTYQGQGLLHDLMRYQLDDVAAHHEPVAILCASEAGLYERFGYGRASFHQHLKIDVREAQFIDDELPGLVELLDVDEARKAIPPVFDAYRTRRPGMVPRSEHFWHKRRLPDAPEPAKGYDKRFKAVHRDGSGEIDGYALYEITQDWPDDLAGGLLKVTELVGLTGDAEAALWRYLLNIALVREVKAWVRPVDDPLSWRLRDPRRLLTTQVPDYLWVRLVRVGEALGQRAYHADGQLVLAVDDPFLPANTGRWKLTVADRAGHAERLPDGGPHDVRLGVADLGSLWLGGVDPAVLRQAGRLVAEDAAVAWLRSAMVTAPAPYCNTLF